MNSSSEHKLVGYDPKTRRIVLEHDIPRLKLAEVKRVARVSKDDPDAIGSYALSRPQVRDIAGHLGVELDRDHLYVLSFFLEPFAAPRRQRGSAPRVLERA